MDGRTDVWRTDWYEINIPYFSKEKAGIALRYWNVLEYVTLDWLQSLKQIFINVS